MWWEKILEGTNFLDKVKTRGRVFKFFGWDFKKNGKISDKYAIVAFPFDDRCFGIVSKLYMKSQGIWTNWFVSVSLENTRKSEKKESELIWKLQMFSGEEGYIVLFKLNHCHLSGYDGEKWFGRW